MPISSSLPSGHTAAAFAFATGAGSMLSGASAPLYLLAALVGYSRVHIGVHYPLLFGLMYAVLSLVPYLGVVTMFTTVELFVLADTGQFGTVFWLSAGIFALIQALEAAVFQPLIPLQAPGLDRSRLPTFLYLWQPEPVLDNH